MKSIRLSVMRIVFVLTILVSLHAVKAASISDQVVLAPVPIMLATAKTVFIANLGGDGVDLSSGVVTQGDTYNEFYAAMKIWNHLTLVEEPREADLVLQIHYLSRVLSTDRTSSELQPARIQLTIVDRATGVPLWVITEACQSWVLQSSGIRSFNNAMSGLTGDFKALVQRASLQVSKSNT